MMPVAMSNNRSASSTTRANPAETIRDLPRRNRTGQPVRRGQRATVPFSRDVAAQERFLTALRNTGGNVQAAIREAGTPSGNSQVYDLLRDDPDFRARYDAAIAAGTAVLEAEAVRRAVEGVDRPLIGGRFKDEVVAYERVYSDNLLTFLLRARKPDTYKDRVASEVSGPGGGPVTVLTAEAKGRAIDEILTLAKTLRGTRPDGDGTGNPPPPASPATS